MCNWEKIIFAALFIAGSFAAEANGTGGWDTFDSRNAVVVNSQTGLVHSGNSAMRLNGASGQQLNQEIDGLVPGEKYAFGGYVYASQMNFKSWTNAGLRIIVSENKSGAELEDICINAATNGWEKFSLEVTAPESGTVWVRCFLYGINSAIVYIDDLRFGKLSGQEEEGSGGIGVAVDQQVGWGGYGCVIDCYNSTAGPYSPASSSSNALVTLNSTAKDKFQMWSSGKVMGDLKIGPGGDIARVVEMSGGSEVTGTIDILEEAVDMSTVPAPSLDIFENGYEGNFELWGSQSTTINSNRYFNKIEMSGDSTIYINGNVTIYAKSSVNISGNASIRLLGNSSLEFYIKNKVDLGGDINADSAAPSKVNIYLTGNNMQFQMYGESKVHAVLYNPTGKLSIWNNAEFFGAAKCRLLEGGGKIHVDMASCFGGSGDVSDGNSEVIRP